MNRSDLKNAKARITSELSKLNSEIRTKEDVEEQIAGIEEEIRALREEKRYLEDKADDLPSADDVAEEEIQSEADRLSDEKRRIEQYIQDHFSESSEEGRHDG